MSSEIVDVVRLALQEDIGPGDVTSEACIPSTSWATGKFIAREPQVIAGVNLLLLIYQLRGGVYTLSIRKENGQRADDGDVIAEVEGATRTLLSCERVALNFLQRLSGVATLASRFVEQVAGTNCKVLDTRKTTPGLRRLEKMASAAGGATNHRMGLYDAILIKNNHITAAGGVRQAIEAARAASTFPIEIEVRTLPELEEALQHGAEALLLDNMPPDLVRQCVERASSHSRRLPLEASGGINLENVRQYAETGVDYISVGSLTHSPTAADLSLRIHPA